MRERLASHLPAELLPSGADVRVLEPAPAEEAAPAAAETPTLLEKMRRKFTVSVEIDPPRGINTQKVIAGAKLMAERGVDCINIADSPMARIRMSAMSLAWQVRGMFPQVEVILHYTTRDRNLMGLQSDLLGAHALGLRNILCLTGDPPSLGDYPNMTAVYDTNSVGLIGIVGKMNQGADESGSSSGGRTNVAIGCAVNPTSEKLDWELEHFRKKLDAGAQFVMTQPVYELAAWERFLEKLGGPPKIPLLIGILPLQSFRHAEFLHNEVPGITLTDAVRDRMRLAGDKGRQEGIKIAQEILLEVKDVAAGTYLMPPFGRFDTAAEVFSVVR